MTERAPAAGLLRILSVEDDSLNRVLLRATLARADDPRLAGAQLVEAPSVADARHELATGDFDLVLLDRRLPDGDGFLLAAELRAQAVSCRPRIVALTADAVPETHQAALGAGCDEVLTKPYVPQVLLDVLSGQLDEATASARDHPSPAHVDQQADCRKAGHGQAAHQQQ